ncbi:hypothetical protein H2203_009098 [Taxawa tesnikishii (nom. ined.)]|nr:hypothetical protein H2203_009098 [Dothideales sp. JES 119]
MCTPLSNNFTALNEQAAQQLNQERQNVVEATLGGRYLDKFSIETAAVMGAASTWSGPTTSGTTSGLQCAMRGALLAIAADLAKGLPDLLAAPDKNAAARQLIPIILRNAAIAGLSFTLVQHLKCYLEKNVPSIAQALGIGLKGTCHTVPSVAMASAAAAGLMTAAIQSLLALWNAVQAFGAACDGDTATRNIELKKVKDRFSSDNVVRMTATALSHYAVNAAVLAAGGLGGCPLLILEAIIIVVTNGLVDAVLKRKNNAGGWLTWLRTFTQQDRRPKQWEFLTVEDERAVTEELQCCIMYTIVVDPVRSLRTGHLYERSAIYRALDMDGRDPQTRHKATRLDYADSPKARKLAQDIAAELGARLVLVTE